MNQRAILIFNLAKCEFRDLSNRFLTGPLYLKIIKKKVFSANNIPKNFFFEKISQHR